MAPACGKAQRNSNSELLQLLDFDLDGVALAFDFAVDLHPVERGDRLALPALAVHFNGHGAAGIFEEVVLAAQVDVDLAVKRDLGAVKPPCVACAVPVKPPAADCAAAAPVSASAARKMESLVMVFPSRNGWDGESVSAASEGSINRPRALCASAAMPYGRRTAATSRPSSITAIA